MQYNVLGKTGIKVSALGFGTLTMGILQKGFTASQAQPVVAKAIDDGINFFDGAELYGSYHVSRQAVKLKNDVIITSKSYTESRQGAIKAVSEALKGIGRDYIDIWLLHGTDNKHTIKGHWPAIEYYLECKQKGIIRSVGFSTHKVAAVRDSYLFQELDIIHPIINYRGLGIEDGTREEMEQAIKTAAANGKGIYAMKVFGGGSLVADQKTALDYALSLEGVASVVIGMQSPDEVQYNSAFFTGKHNLINDNLRERIKQHSKSINIKHYCIVCGECVSMCPFKALEIKSDKLSVNKSKCMLCGYCASKCKLGAIKLM